MRTRAVSSAPPFCPNEACEHHCAPTSSWRWLRAGFFSRRAAPCRIQRYRCVDCGRYFSEQTFRTTYWLRCPQLLEERSEDHTSELQSHSFISYAVFCLKKKNKHNELASALCV